MGRNKKEEIKKEKVTSNTKTKLSKTSKVKSNSNVKMNNNKHKLYFSFNTRLIFYICTFIILFVFGLIFLLKSISFIEQKVINYDEKSNLDYKVYLKENDFYETPYLGKNMLYIASLIDKIIIDFNYNFKSSENINLDFNYNIMGKLVISDSDEKNTYYEKEYTLLEDKKIFMQNNNNQIINESIAVDYDYYNSLANDFKMTFGVNTTSNLIIYLTIDKSDNKQAINAKSIMLIRIPLSEKAINIKMDYKEIDNSSTILSDSYITIDNLVYIIASLTFIIFSIVALIKSIRLIYILIQNNKNIYDKYINRLLMEYDRLIVETTTQPLFDNKEIIKVEKFQELLDVRDNLKLPITYYSITKHQKCYFYISEGDKVYLHIVKAVDLENKEN
ncbi:MAG: DUF5305 family protein [Bacilli bacterium]